MHLPLFRLSLQFSTDLAWSMYIYIQIKQIFVYIFCFFDVEDRVVIKYSISSFSFSFSSPFSFSFSNYLLVPLPNVTRSVSKNSNCVTISISFSIAMLISRPFILLIFCILTIVMQYKNVHCHLFFWLCELYISSIINPTMKHNAFTPFFVCCSQ